MKKQIGFGLGVALSLSLVGCLFGGDEDKISSSSSGQIVTPGVAPIPVTFSFQNRIQIDGVNKLLLASYSHCDSNAVVTTRWDTAYYQINTGALLTWNKNDCFADQYLGNNSSVLGSWTRAKGSVNVDLPATAVKSPYCSVNSYRDTSSSDEVMTLAKDLITSTEKFDYCWAAERKGKKTALDCHQYLDTNKTTPGDRIGKYTLLQYNTSTGARRYTLEYNGQTCEYNSLNTPVIANEITTTQCQQAVASYKADTAKYKQFSYYTYIKRSMGIVSPYTSFDSCQVKIGYHDQLNR